MDLVMALDGLFRLAANPYTPSDFNLVVICFESATISAIVLGTSGIAEVPKTIADMVADSKQITTKLKSDGVYGFAANLKSPSSAITRSIIQILERSGY